MIGSLNTRDPILAGVELRDISLAIKAFHSQKLVLDALGLPQPCAHFVARELRGHDAPELLVPINLSSAIPKIGTRTFRASKEHIQLEIRRQINDAIAGGLKIADWPTDMMEDVFSDLIRDFLRLRIKFSKKWFRPRFLTKSYAGGLNVTVHSKKPNCKILYSEALIFNQNQSFSGGLSTPAHGQLNPGIYIFGARDATNTTWEAVHERIPPTTIRTVYA